MKFVMPNKSEFELVVPEGASASDITALLRLHAQNIGNPSLAFYEVDAIDGDRVTLKQGAAKIKG